MTKLHYYEISNDNITPIHFPALERRRRILLLLAALGLEILTLMLYT